MPKVERAIIMAAGLGNRMHPVTLTTPKPLVKVNGTRMIDVVYSSDSAADCIAVCGKLYE